MDFLSQCVRILLLFIYRFPGEYAYQKECSLGKSHQPSAVHRSLISELWQQGQGSKTAKPSPSEGWKWHFPIKVLN